MASAHTAPPPSDGTQGPTEFYYNYSDNESLVFLPEDASQLFGATFSAAAYSAIFALSLAGNGLLLWALLAREDPRKSTTLFLLQLAAADLLLTASLPFWAVHQLHGWVFGRAACHLLVLVFFLGFYGYMLLLAAVTADRYLAVVHAVSALHLRSRRCAGLASAALWLACLAASLPEAVHSDTGPDGRRCEASPRPAHAELLAYAAQLGLFFLLPLGLVVFCYARIWATVSGCRSARRHRATRLILCVVAGFLACWTPYNVVLLLGALRLAGTPALAGPGAAEKLAYAYYVCHALAFCHCFLNPALHVFGSARFRGYLAGRRRGSRGRSLSHSTANGTPRSSASHQMCV